VIPWDKDNTFLQADMPIFNRVDDNVISQRLLEYEDLRALYLDTLDRCARAAEEDGWLLAEVTRSASLVDAAAREDTRKLFANDAFDAGVEFMKEFAAGRPAFVEGEIERARAGR
jgi:hypothetical protein